MTSDKEQQGRGKTPPLYIWGLPPPPPSVSPSPPTPLANGPKTGAQLVMLIFPQKWGKPRVFQFSIIKPYLSKMFKILMGKSALQKMGFQKIFSGNFSIFLGCPLDSRFAN